MTLGVVIDVSAPAETYDVVHAAMLEQLGPTTVDGLLVHLARATEDGFQVVEVWESAEARDRASREVVGPAAARALQGGEIPGQRVTEFEVRGLVLPRAGVAV